MELFGIIKDKKYLLAVSGGIDSMVLAQLFLDNKFEFAIAHCNFQLRASESEGDEILVKSWCEENHVEFFTKKFNTKDFAEQNKKSIQVSARELRYHFFDEICRDRNFDFIATAHHLNDSIETMLFHFFRGTGIQGMTGIPFQNGNVVRPLLYVTRDQINDFANHRNVKFREDSSNLKSDYTRNKIRNQIIPFLKDSFPRLDNSLAENIERFAETNEIYKQHIQLLTKKLIEKRGNEYYIPIRKLMKQQPIKSILYELLKPFDFSFQQSIEVLKIMESQSGVYVENEQFRVLKNREFLIITSKKVVESEMILIDESTTHIETKQFEMEIAKRENISISKEQNILQVEISQLNFPLLLRKWKVGDYMYPFGMSKKKKVSRILIDAKLSLHEKENVWVLESDKKIIWILGIKSDNRFRIHDTTHEAMVFNLKFK